MESTGKRERVHLSEQTALRLIEQGRGEWIVRREDVIEAKGKGRMVTFWLKLLGSDKAPESVAETSDEGSERPARKERINESCEWNVEMPASKLGDADRRYERLVEWNSELLLELLQRVVSRRLALKSSDIATSSVCQKRLASMACTIGDGSMVVNEVVEVIDMPEFICMNENNKVDLDRVVVDQLRDFAAKIASMYNNNPCKLQTTASRSLSIRI
jgi:hypothetical protein